MLDTLASLYPYTVYGTIICLAVAELIVPARRPTVPLNRRWSTNIGLFLIGLGVHRLLVPLSAFTASVVAMSSDYGLLQLIVVPDWVVVLFGLLVLDLWKYIEHRLLHGVAILWRLHVVHHSDTDIDFTTAERHHPLELVLGALGLYLVVSIFGIPPLAIAIYLLLATTVALVAHANLRINTKADTCLRWLIVTPSYHSVHHSAVRHETDSNFGSLLTAWDRFFGTYRAPSRRENESRVVGLEYFRDAHAVRLDRVLLQPFLSHERHTDALATETKDHRRLAR